MNGRDRDNLFLALDEAADRGMVDLRRFRKPEGVTDNDLRAFLNHEALKGWAVPSSWHLVLLRPAFHRRAVQIRKSRRKGQSPVEAPAQSEAAAPPPGLSGLSDAARAILLELRAKGTVSRFRVRFGYSAMQVDSALCELRHGAIMLIHDGLNIALTETGRELADAVYRDEMNRRAPRDAPKPAPPPPQSAQGSPMLAGSLVRMVRRVWRGIGFR